MKRLAPDDVVPPLRNKLVVRAPPVGNGAEVIDVGPADVGDHLQLHGFEFSMARMLDGKRTAHEVMRNCAQLGIPLSLRSLEGFLRELELHGLLAREGRLSGGVASAEVRGRPAWDPVVRDDFRAALRTARAGKLEEARKRLETVLAESPGNVEAAQLLEWIERQQEPATAKPEQSDFLKVYRTVETRWRTQLPHDLGSRLPTRHLVARALRPALRPALYVGLGVMLVLAMLFVPLPRVMTSAVRLSPISEQKVVAERDGLVDAVVVREGARVSQGAELFTWDVSTELAQLAELRAMLAQAQGVDPNAPAAQPPPASDIAFLNQRADELQRAIEARRVLAPRAGIVRGLRATPGDFIEKDQPLFQIDDIDQLKMVALVTPRQARLVNVGEPLTVRIGEQQFATQVEAVSSSEIVATLKAASSTLEPGSEVVDLELSPESLWKRIW